MYTYGRLTHVSQQKLTQYCKAITFQFKKLKKKKTSQAEQNKSQCSHFQHTTSLGDSQE